MKKFPTMIFATRDETPDEPLVVKETLNELGVIGKRVRVAEYQLTRVVEITTDAKVTTEVGE